jgi:hypothetical protein
MKKILLIFCIPLLLLDQIEAQEQNDYLFFIQTIDSLKNVLINGGTVEMPQNYWDFNSLSLNDRNMVLDYVETLYAQTEYGSFYNLGINLLVTFYENDDKNTQDKIARLYLDKAFYSFSESFTNLGKVVDYSEQTKERVKNILEKNRTEEDINARIILAKRRVKRRNSEEIENSVKKIMRETRRKGHEVEIYLTDSLTNAYIEKDVQWMNEYPPFERFTILQIGGSKDLRFIEGLEKILMTDYASFRLNSLSGWEFQINSIKEACVYALAKLGVNKYVDEVFSNEEDIKWQYIGTQEAFIRWLELSLRWDRWRKTNSSAKDSLPIAVVHFYWAMRYLPQKIVPIEIGIGARHVEYFDITVVGENYDPFKDEKNRETIERIYKLFDWIKNNQDKWELPPAQDRF